LSIKVLLIDDHEAVRKVTEDGFRHHPCGIELRTASSAEDGLVLAAKFEPAVIVLDHFPTRDRLHSDQALAFIRHSKTMRKVKVVGMCDSRKVGVKMLEAGANEYIIKPFALEELKDAIFRQSSMERRKANRRNPLLALIGDPARGT
jgi:DNA-binding response OmpR family regulator